MIIATLAYPKQIHVQVLEVWSEAGRTWAKVKALDCQPFTAVHEGTPYDSDWTVVDNHRLHDVCLLFPQPDLSRPSRKARARRLEEKLLHEQLLGGSRERKT